MTGEITLRGKVLPVGGIREKVMAAHRAGIRKVLIPKENEADIQDIPEAVRNEIEFVLLTTVKDALEQGACEMKINKSELEAVAVKPAQYPPENLKEIAFAGRSNVGKSSLLNLITGRKKLARVSGSPGKTRTINFYL